ncbi:MAG: autotransporter assembly complex protein TamA [Pseudomonadales bacterium]|nr:autotransporter assembly complex protein TamA [Pseudomonadales bacterium]
MSQAQLKLDISGVATPLEENIRLHLSRWQHLPKGEPETVRRSIRKAVLRSLQPLGYYDPEIEMSVVEDKLTLDIKPGPPVTWGEVKLSISEDLTSLPTPIQNIATKHPFVVGEIINHKLYDDYKRQLLLIAKQEGYLNAEWGKSQLLVNKNVLQAQVVLSLILGERFRIGAIDIEGTELSEKTVHTLINSNPGEWYSSDKIGNIYDNLLGSGYFKNAIINIEPEQPDQANLGIELIEQPRHQFATGIGYGTDTGARGKFGWTRSRLNKRGDSLYTKIKLSQISQEVTAQYKIPWPHPLERYLSWDTGWKQEITTDRETSLLTTGLSFVQSKGKHWQSSYGVNLENETYRQGDNPSESITYVLPNFHYLARHIEGDRLNPSSIFKYWFDTSLGFAALTDHTLFLSSVVGASYSMELSENHGLATRAEFGAIMTDDFYDVPVSKRFYTGGDQTVRGYKYNALAPEDTDGELIGGQFLNVLSVEHQYRVAQNWKLATFVDTGRTYISSHDPFHSGAGFGARWQLPIGTMAFDLAKPVTGEDDSSVRIHIYMGILL